MNVHLERITKELKKQAEDLNFDGIEFPTPCTERMFKKFENNNQINVSVFGYAPGSKSDYTIIPLYVSEGKYVKTNRLFFWKNDDGTKCHYGVVNDMSRLIAAQNGKKTKKFVCDRCLCLFWKQTSLDKHSEYCSEHDAVKIEMPVKGVNDILRFKNIHHQIPVPIMFTGDFECFTKPVDETRGQTRLYQKHEPSAFSLYTLSRVEGFSPSIVTHVCADENDNVAKAFVKAAEDSVKEIYNKFKNPAKMIFNEKEKILHDSQIRCYACSGGFDDDSIEKRKVRDHCHLTGTYRGALHSKCNLRLRRSITFPVVFHNLTGYDSHLFVKDLADSCGNVEAIPHNEKKYMSFTKKVLVDEQEINENDEIKIKKVYWKLKFIDSMNFAKSSLEKLIDNLDKPQLKHMQKHFQGKKLDLMCSKGVYPYEYMSDVSKLYETHLPFKDAFASKLNVGSTNITSELVAEDIIIR